MASRVTDIQKAYRPGHRFGNWLLTSMVSWIFGSRFTDMLSGYRVMSRRYVKSFPALSAGFETETELTVHALELRMPIAEIVTPYKDRPEGSVSKLSTFKDGFRILWTILVLVKEERPMQFFSLLALVFAVVVDIADYSNCGTLPAHRICAAFANGSVIHGLDDLSPSLA